MKKRMHNNRKTLFKHWVKLPLFLLLALYILPGLNTYGFAAEETSPAAASSEEATKQKLLSSSQEAQAFVQALAAGDAQDLEAYLYTEEMNMALSQMGGMTGLQKSLAVLGEWKGMQDAVSGSAQGLSFYRIPCLFSSLNVDIVIYLDESLAIAGISTDRFTGTVPEETSASASLKSLTVSIPVSSFEGALLEGTLTLPEGEGPFPLVILVHGSGPNDRDESIGSNAPFRDIAEGLSAKGIAVYRYDKRTYTYGRQLMGDTSLTLYEETIEDAVTAVQTLAAQEMIDASRIYVLGHSLGGMALPAIDACLDDMPVKACGYVFLAAPARPLTDLLAEQYRFLLSFISRPSLEKWKEKVEIARTLHLLKNPDKLPDDVALLGAYPAYWKYLQSYDILKTAEGISLPCLVLQGEEDYQVSMEDFQLWKDTFEGNENWQFRSFPGLTHLMIPGLKEDGTAPYYSPSKVDEEVISAIADFIR